VILRRRIWAETVSARDIDRALVAALARRKMGLIVAAWPGPRDDLLALASRCRDVGVPLCVWPMLADAEGRWASAGNLSHFTAFVRMLVEELRAHGAPPAEVALDLEPPIDRVRRLLDLRPSGLAPVPLDELMQARAMLAALLHDLRARGTAVSAAVMPMLLVDPPGKAGGIERWLGTPVTDLDWDHASAMLYTSLIEGYSRGLLRRADARALLWDGASRTLRRFGRAAGVSLGAVGPGALGDEPIYRDVGELRDDVALVRAAGIDDLALFDLGGVLRRPPIEPWLDAFVDTAPARDRPRITARSAGVVGAGMALSRLLGRLG
jgi:hypothetical protein